MHTPVHNYTRGTTHFSVAVRCVNFLCTANPSHASFPHSHAYMYILRTRVYVYKCVPPQSNFIQAACMHILKICVGTKPIQDVVLCIHLQA